MYFEFKTERIIFGDCRAFRVNMAIVRACKYFLKIQLRNILFYASHQKPPIYHLTHWLRVMVIHKSEGYMFCQSKLTYAQFGNRIVNFFINGQCTKLFFGNLRDLRKSHVPISEINDNGSVPISRFVKKDNSEFVPKNFQATLVTLKK